MRIEAADDPPRPGWSEMDAARTAIVEVQHHGWLEVKRAFERIARSLGLLVYHMGQSFGDYTDPVVLPRIPWNPACPEWPTACYPDAVGQTRVWWGCYHLGERSAPWKIWEPLQSAWHPGMSYLLCSAATWSYMQKADSETRLVVSIQSLPVWRGAWEIDERNLENHKKVTDMLAARMYVLLTKTPAPASPRRIRGRITWVGGQSQEAQS